jgi:hypothetical protein
LQQQEQVTKQQNEQAVSGLLEMEMERLYKQNPEANSPKYYGPPDQQHHEQQHHEQQQQQQKQHDQHHPNYKTCEGLKNIQQNGAPSENKTSDSELDKIEATTFHIENWDELLKSCFD